MTLNDLKDFLLVRRIKLTEKYNEACETYQSLSYDDVEYKAAQMDCHIIGAKLREVSDIIKYLGKADD